MSQLLHAPLTFALALCVAASACADKAIDQTNQTDDTNQTDETAEVCRTYGTSGSIAFGEATGILSCDYDESRGELACDIDSGDLELQLRRTYASLADFVEEARHVGKTTSLSETEVENGQPKTTTHSYDELGRLIGSTEVREEVTLESVFSNHDDAGRPRLELLTYASDGGTCENLRVDVAYDDVARTVSRTFAPEPGSPCGFEARTDVDQYDEAGNLVSAREGGQESQFEATMIESDTLCL